MKFLIMFSFIISLFSAAQPNEDVQLVSIKNTNHKIISIESNHHKSDGLSIFKFIDHLPDGQMAVLASWQCEGAFQPLFLCVQKSGFIVLAGSLDGRLQTQDGTLFESEQRDLFFGVWRDSDGIFQFGGLISADDALQILGILTTADAQLELVAQGNGKSFRIPIPLQDDGVLHNQEQWIEWEPEQQKWLRLELIVGPRLQPGSKQGTAGNHSPSVPETNRIAGNGTSTANPSGDPTQGDDPFPGGNGGG